jgi:Leucine rich repeat
MGYALKIALLFVLLIWSPLAAVADEVACEVVMKFRMLPDWDEESTCMMDNVTVIETRGVVISSVNDESVPGLTFDDNKNIFFLPSAIFKALPKLKMLSAYSCSIAAVFRENFENLTDLKCLWLSGNRINKIFSDTFQDLTSLELLDLSKKIFHSIAISQNDFLIVQTRTK